MSARGKPSTAVKNPAKSERGHKSLVQLAAEQGIHLPQDVQAIAGAGADLWDSDADFEAFLNGLRESRRSKD